MKKCFYLVASLLLISLYSCKQKKITPPDNPIATSADVSIKFQNEVSGQPVTMGQLIYTTPAGNKYSIELLKYFVTGVILVKDDGTEFKLNNYDLINAFDANFSTVEAKGVPNGNYVSMKFLLGVDKANNHTIGTGDLDPQYNMAWGWVTGYIFYKHEGKFINSNNEEKSLTFHLGTDDALGEVVTPISLSVQGVARKMNIVFDVNKMYNSPVIDFNQNAFRMSDIGDEAWMLDMKINSNDAFSFKNVE